MWICFVVTPVWYKVGQFFSFFLSVSLLISKPKTFIERKHAVKAAKSNCLSNPPSKDLLIKMSLYAKLSLFADAISLFPRRPSCKKGVSVFFCNYFGQIALRSSEITYAKRITLAWSGIFMSESLEGGFRREIGRLGSGDDVIESQRETKVKRWCQKGVRGRLGSRDDIIGGQRETRVQGWCHMHNAYVICICLGSTRVLCLPFNVRGLI